MRADWAESAGKSLLYLVYYCVILQDQIEAYHSCMFFFGVMVFKWNNINKSSLRGSHNGLFLTTLQIGLIIAKNLRRKVIKETSIFMVVSDKPKLSPCVCIFVIWSNKAKDVFMTQHYCLINVWLTKPRGFISTGENFDSHIFPSPSSTPHFSISSFANNLYQCNLPCYAPLNQQWITWNNFTDKVVY